MAHQRGLGPLLATANLHMRRVYGRFAKSTSFFYLRKKGPHAVAIDGPQKDCEDQNNECCGVLNLEPLLHLDVCKPPS